MGKFVNVRHKGTPAEPFAQQGMLGRITATDNGYRITPAHRGIPALAHCQWTHETLGDFCTWELLSQLTVIRTKPKGKQETA